MKAWSRGLMTAAVVVGTLSVGWAATDADVAALKEQIAQLQGQVVVLEKKLADQSPDQAARISPAVLIEDPFVQMQALQRQMNSLMAPGFGTNMMAIALPQRSGFGSDYDLKETGTSYIVSLDVPGMDKAKINVEVKGGALLISGERSDKVEEKDGDKTYFQQRSFGYFSQAIPLPKDAKPDSVQAKYEDGVLKVTIAKNASTNVKVSAGQKIEVK